MLIDKPAGMTSFGVVARVRRVLTERKRASHESAGECPTLKNGRCRCKVKVGHTGTLDPFATGLMILVVGKECKNAGIYSKLDKIYEATVTLGKTSTTGDPEGEIVEHGRLNIEDSDLTVENVRKCLEQFTGQIEQTPPIYSAIKINGQRAYKLARKGETVEMPSRKITIYELSVRGYAYPELKIRVHVSSGTYIRTLAEDIGKQLGTGAYCSELRRTSIDKWSVEQAELLSNYTKD